MKLLKFEKKDKLIEKRLNKKKVLFTVIILIVILILIIISGIYIANMQFRETVDTYILRKNITENNAALIEVQTEKNPCFAAYDRYIVKIEDNLLTKYSSNGKVEDEIKLEISNPIFDSNDKCFVVAEKDKQKIYSLSDKEVLWEKDLDGNISRVSINKNGYVAVILNGTTYKSIIAVFDRYGKELFRIYLANTVAIDCAISDDNKYISFAEIVTSGTEIQSNIKTLSIDKAKNRQDAYTFTKNVEDNSLVVSIKYQEKNNLAVLYNDRIDIVKGEEISTLRKLDNREEKLTFADINLYNSIFSVIEKNGGLFSSDSTVEILNTNNSKKCIYLVNSAIKNMYSNENIIAINLGTEVHFVSTNTGWLIKKYSSKKEIKKIVLSNKIAAIIYHDKIEIIDL